MARPLRIEYPGAVYHVTGRGNARQNVFLCEEDRTGFLDLLTKVNRRYNWVCHAYCLMDNHYHLVLETHDGNLSHGMRQLGSVYTQAFNRRHDRVGHLFQGRYKAVLVQKESHLLEVVRYVVLNPVRAGVVNAASGYNWSSFLATAGLKEPDPCLKVDWILSQFGEKPGPARSRYSRFVADGVGENDLWQGLRGQTLLGRDDFTENLRSALAGLHAIDEIPRSERHVSRASLLELFGKETENDRQLRNDRMIAAVELNGYTQKEIADHLGLHYSTISRLLKAAMSKVKT